MIKSTVAKVSASWSSKTDENEYLTGKKYCLHNSIEW